MTKDEWRKAAYDRGEYTLNVPPVLKGKGTMPDFTVENHGSIFLLRPHTNAAEEWLDEHMPEDAQYLGNAVVVEHRYIVAIVEGAEADGLECQ